MSIEEVARNGLKELSVLLRMRRLRWFGHKERREGNEALERAVMVEVPSRCHNKEESKTSKLPATFKKKIILPNWAESRGKVL